MSAEATRVPIAPIYLEHFDEGMIRALGGIKQSIVIDGEEAYYYSVLVPGVCGPEAATYKGAIPIFFGKGREVIHPFLLPSITVIRAGVEDDMTRVRHKTLAHRVPAFRERQVVIQRPDGSQQIGFARMDEKEAEWPVNITYNVQIRIRGEIDFLRMFRWVMTHLPHQNLQSYITVWDAADVPREYNIFRESMSDIGEYVDVNDVVKGYEFSYRVEGEFEIEEPTVGSTAQQYETTVAPLEG